MSARLEVPNGDKPIVITVEGGRVKVENALSVDVEVPVSTKYGDVHFTSAECDNPNDALVMKFRLSSLNTAYVNFERKSYEEKVSLTEEPSASIIIDGNKMGGSLKFIARKPYNLKMGRYEKFVLDLWELQAPLTPKKEIVQV